MTPGRQQHSESGGGRRSLAVTPHRTGTAASRLQPAVLSSGTHTHAQRTPCFASCRRADDKKPVTRCTCDGRVLLLLLFLRRVATCTPESPAGFGGLNEDIAAMVKNKAENRTLQYQQTLVSFSSCVGYCRPFQGRLPDREDRDEAAACSAVSCHGIEGRLCAAVPYSCTNPNMMLKGFLLCSPSSSYCHIQDPSPALPSFTLIHRCCITLCLHPPT